MEEQIEETHDDHRCLDERNEKCEGDDNPAQRGDGGVALGEPPEEGEALEPEDEHAAHIEIVEHRLQHFIFRKNQSHPDGKEIEIYESDGKFPAGNGGKCRDVLDAHATEEGLRECHRCIGVDERGRRNRKVNRFLQCLVHEIDLALHFDQCVAAVELGQDVHRFRFHGVKKISGKECGIYAQDVDGKKHLRRKSEKHGGGTGQKGRGRADVSFVANAEHDA